MKRPLLSAGLRGGIVGAALVLGCSRGQCPAPPAALPLAASPRAAGGPQDTTAATVPAEPRATRRPEVRVLEVLSAKCAAAEQDAGPSNDPWAAAAVYGHAPDYRWLTGELRYSPARGAWCLHYASEEEEDRHGGSVTLVGTGPMTGLRPGQAVRVEGQMIDPNTREPSAPYRVHRLRPLPRG
jgi:hypothetical protein